MERSEEIKKAIFNMGGPKLAAESLQVSTSAISKWVRKGMIPNLNQAKRVAEASGFDLASLRPKYEQKAM
jgi:hypothetical protein